MSEEVPEVPEVKVYHRNIPYELDLPYSQEKLLMIQKNLDQSINMCYSRQAIANFNNLKSLIEKQT